MSTEKTPSGTAAATIGVEAKSGSYSFACEPGERVLYAGLRHGVPLPYECATGTCGTCKARTEASVVGDTWSEAPGRSYLKPERGEFLMCQCVTQGSCTIKVPGKLAPPPDGATSPNYNRGRLNGLKRLTHDVMAFDIDLEQPMDFQAGQFVVIKTPGIEGFRAYSMVNYEPATTCLTFVVKRKPGGVFSERLFGPGLEDVTVELFGPLGKAVFRPEEKKNLLAIAGGSGIAGIMSILSRAVQENYFARHTGAVFFGVRTMQDGFFLEELSAYVAASSGNLEVTMAVSEDQVTSARHPDYPSLKLASGFVHTVTSESMAERYDNVAAFVAGPPPMVDGALRMLIIEARLPTGDIRYDKFG